MHELYNCIRILNQAILLNKISVNVKPSNYVVQFLVFLQKKGFIYYYKFSNNIIHVFLKTKNYKYTLQKIYWFNTKNYTFFVSKKKFNLLFIKEPMAIFFISGKNGYKFITKDDPLYTGKVIFKIT